MSLKHQNTYFLTLDFSKQNGVSVKLSNILTSLQCHRQAQHFREQKHHRNHQSKPQHFPV